LAHTVDAVATGSCKNLEKRCIDQLTWTHLASFPCLHAQLALQGVEAWERG